MSTQAHLQQGAPRGSVSTEPATLGSALTQVLDDMPDGILLLDENWRITYANQTACKISRLTPQDFNHKTHWELYPETLGTSLESTYHDVMTKRVEGRIQAFYYAPFQVWLDVRILPLKNSGIALYYRDVTETHIAEEVVRSTTAHLEQVLTATTDGVVSVDRQWRISYMNRRAMEILAPSGEVLHTNVWESFPDANFEGSPFVDHFQRAMNESISGSFEAFYPEPLNAWLHLTIRPSSTGFICFFRDITEDRRREDELRSSEERYRVLTELSPQSLWSADALGRVLYANQRFLDYLGRSFVPVDGTEYLSCFDERDRERIAAAWSQSVATGQDYSIEARLLRGSDNASRWWHLRAGAIRDDQGVIHQWLGTAIDVHEERLASDHMLEQYVEIDRQRRELETIYRGSPIGMALYEPKELRLLRINDRQTEIFRLADPGHAVGKTYAQLASGVDGAQKLIRRAASGENVLNQDIEGTLDRHPEEYRYWNVNYSPIFDEAGTVQAIAAATVETTHQRRAEAALIQSEKLAAVGRMASSIAHEINNPLESVTNLIYIARSYAILPEVQNFLDLADQELRRVSIIANQTLRFHKQATSPREVSCSDLLATVLSLYEGRLRNSGIQVERRKHTLQRISCFEGDIRQVLNNLVSNAIDAMPTGGRLLLRSRKATDWRTGRRGVVLTIADNGKGIPPDVLSHIFEAFFTTKGNQGTGLGLWISTEILERHLGRLLVRSSQAKQHHGTVFSVFLPFISVLSESVLPLVQQAPPGSC